MCLVIMAGTNPSVIIIFFSLMTAAFLGGLTCCFTFFSKVCCFPELALAPQARKHLAGYRTVA